MKKGHDLADRGDGGPLIRRPPGAPDRAIVGGMEKPAKMTPAAKVALGAAEARAVKAEQREAELRGLLERLRNELRGVAGDVDGECLCDEPRACDCGGDGVSAGDAIEYGCAACWAIRLREVADGKPWPPRALADRTPKDREGERP